MLGHVAHLAVELVLARVLGLQSRLKLFFFLRESLLQRLTLVVKFLNLCVEHHNFLHLRCYDLLVVLLHLVVVEPEVTFVAHAIGVGVGLT